VIRSVLTAKLCIMNSYSPEQIAESLGTSRRRVVRAAEMSGVGRRVGSRTRFSGADRATLAKKLGVTPRVEGLSRIEAVVLAELSRRPFGLVSHRAIARATSLAPASASKATKALLNKGLATETPTTVALGRAQMVNLVKANSSHPDWTRLLSQLAMVVPATETTPEPVRLPDHVRHAFWNVDDEQFRKLDLAEDGPFIAARALSTNDPNLMAFAARHLRAEAWLKVMGLRGLSAETRQAARNFAAAAEKVRK